MRRAQVISTMLIVVLCALGVAAQADIYSYTDDDGVVHFTNMKPRGGGQWKKILDSAPPPGSKASSGRGSRYDKVAATDKSPERYHRYDHFIAEASELYRIPVALIRAIIRSESDFDANVVSGLDCKGLMQIHPAVEIDMGVQGDIFDPRTNIMAGTRLLRHLANRLDGDIVLTIAAYHAGLGSIAKYGYSVPPYSYTRQYLKTVLDRYYQYKTEFAKARAQ